MRRGPAFEQLAELFELRLARRTPKHGVFVTTGGTYTELFTSMGFATVEVWHGDQLDWRPVAGVRVIAVVQWKDQAERLELFEAIRAHRPSEFLWYAIEHGTGNFMGQMRLMDGEPMLMENPMLLAQQFIPELGKRPVKPGPAGELRAAIDKLAAGNFWRDADPWLQKQRLTNHWWTYGQV